MSRRRGKGKHRMYPDYEPPTSRIGFHPNNHSNYTPMISEPTGLKQPTEIVFSWQSWEKIHALRDHHSSTEVGFLMLRDPDSIFNVDDILVPKQIVSGGSVKFDPDSINDLKALLYETNRLHLLMPGWGHTHPSSGASPSSVDKDTFSDSYSQGPYAFMFIAGKGQNADYTCAFRAHLRDIKSYVEIQLKILAYKNPTEEKYATHAERVAAIREYADFIDTLPDWLTQVNSQISTHSYNYNNSNNPHSTNKGVQPSTTTEIIQPTSPSLLTGTTEGDKQVFTDPLGNVYDWDGDAGTLEQRGPNHPAPSLEQSLSIVKGITDRMDDKDKDKLMALKLSEYKELKSLAEELFTYAPMIDGQIRIMSHLKEAELHLADDMYEWNWKHYRQLPPVTRQRVDIILSDEFGYRIDEHGLLKI